MSHLPHILAIFDLGAGEIFMIVFLCLLMFGSKKLPELAKAFGQSMREFKKAASEVEDNFHSAVREEERKKSQTPPPPPPAPVQQKLPQENHPVEKN